MTAIERTKAIVLRRTNYGEADRILTLLTPLGQRSAITSHSPLPSHWLRPSRRGRERTCGRHGPATRKGGRRASSRLRPAALIIALQHEPR